MGLGPTMWATAFKTILFTLIAPGTVTVLLPYLILRGRARELSSDVFTIIGCLLILTGAVIYVACAFSFVRFGRGTPAPIDPPKELVVKGLYRWSRNPMYVGIISILIGEAILFRSTALLGYAAVVFVGFNLFILCYEEPTLRQMFGESYERYCKTVPRWIIPRIVRRHGER